MMIDDDDDDDDDDGGGGGDDDIIVEPITDLIMFTLRKAKFGYLFISGRHDNW